MCRFLNLTICRYGQGKLGRQDHVHAQRRVRHCRFLFTARYIVGISTLARQILRVDSGQPPASPEAGGSRRDGIHWELCVAWNASTSLRLPPRQPLSRTHRSVLFATIQHRGGLLNHSSDCLHNNTLPVKIHLLRRRLFEGHEFAGRLNRWHPA